MSFVPVNYSCTLTKNGTALALGLIAAVAVPIATPIAFFSATFSWSNFHFKHFLPIAALSIRDIDEATKAAFRRRVQANFPLGSQVKELKQELC